MLLILSPEYFSLEGFSSQWLDKYSNKSGIKWYIFKQGWSHAFTVWRMCKPFAMQILAICSYSYATVISYKLVKGFLAITFLSYVISSWNLYDVCQCFLYGQKPNFSWIRQKMINFPIGPQYKNRPNLVSGYIKNVDTHHESFS